MILYFKINTVWRFSNHLPNYWQLYYFSNYLTSIQQYRQLN